MAIDPKILEKIRKCLALSKSPEPHEAAAALRQAQKLMELHGVSEEGVAMADLAEESFTGYTVSRVRPWEAMLVNLVKRAFGCQVVFRNGNSYTRTCGKYIFIGQKHQAKLAAYTAAVLYRKILAARQRYVEKVTAAPYYKNRAEASAAGDSFCQGWVVEISKQVHELAQPPEVLRLIDKRREDLLNGSTQKASLNRREADANSFYAGKDAAKGEALHRPMEGGKQQLKLGVM